MKHIDPKKTIPVAWAGNVFRLSPDAIHREYREAGQSLAEIAASVPIWRWDEFQKFGEIRMNNHPVPVEYWHVVRPRVDGPVPVFVTLHLAPGRGGSSSQDEGKSPFAALAMIALVAVTTIVSGGFGAGVAGGWFAAGTTSAQLLGAGVGIVGSLAIGALTAPPVNQDKTQRGETIGSASADGNVLRKSVVIPRVVGTHKIFPPLAQDVLIERIGEDEYASVVYPLSGPHQLPVSQMYLGDTPINGAPDIEYQTREGWDDDTPLTLVTRQCKMTDTRLELSNFKIDTGDDSGVFLNDQVTPSNSIPRWHRIAGRRSPNEIWMHLDLPEGLYKTTSSIDTYIPFRIRIRRKGQVTWINLPEFMLTNRNNSSALRKSVKLKWSTGKVGSSSTYGDTSVSNPISSARRIGFWTARTTTVAASYGDGAWVAHSNFIGGSGETYFVRDFVTGRGQLKNVILGLDDITFLLDEAVIPKGEYEIEIKRGLHLANFVVQTYEYSPVSGLHDFFSYYTSGGHRVVVEQNSLKGSVYLTRVVNIWNEHPVGLPGMALVAIRARNRRLEQFSVVASGYVPDWDGSGWNDWKVTSNPAPNLAYALIGGLNADPLPLTMLDQSVLTNWRSRCATEGYEVNAIFDGQPLSEVLDIIAGCGYARPAQSEKFGVVQDYDRTDESIVQLFSTQNMMNFRWEKAFPKTPNGFLVKYKDEDLNYEDTEMVVYGDGYGPSTPNLKLEEYPVNGITNSLKVEDRALFDLGQAKRRSTYYYGTIEMESLWCRRGDLVGVQYDIIDRFSGSSTIEAVLKNGSDEITGLLLESGIKVNVNPDGEPNPGVNTGLAIQMTDGTVTVKRLTGTGTNMREVTFETPFADPGTVVVWGENKPLIRMGCQVVSGRVNQEYRKLVLASIRPGKDFKADITLVDHASELFQVVGSARRTIAITASASSVVTARPRATAELKIDASATALPSVIAAASSEIIINATGDNRKRTLTSANAQIVMTAQAVVVRQTYGAAAPTIALNAVADSWRTTFGSMSAALVIDAVLTPHLLIDNGGSAHLSIDYGDAAAFRIAYGVSSVDLSIEAVADSLRHSLLAGSASLEISATADNHRTTFSGQMPAPMVVTAQAVGLRFSPGDPEDQTIEIEVEAAGYRIAYGSGDATLEIIASSGATAEVITGGGASIEVQATAANLHTKKTDGNASISIAAVADSIIVAAEPGGFNIGFDNGFS